MTRIPSTTRSPYFVVRLNPRLRQPSGKVVGSDHDRNGVLNLLLHPEQLVAIRDNPNLLASAIEEILRYDGPASMAIRRFATDDIEIGGVTIPAGDTVLLSLASANRDPEAFENPDHFDVQRRENPHTSFGHGIHYCLGASLARMEAEIAIATLLRRFPTFTLAALSDELSWRPSLRTRSLYSLPIIFG